MKRECVEERAVQFAARSARVVVEHANGYMYHGIAAGTIGGKLILRSTTSAYQRGIEFGKIVALHEWHEEAK